jgi:AraC-like DNA-binding protein
VSSRTLQRYFEATTSISSKQAFQILRIRKAIVQLLDHPGNFNPAQFGYYDQSHFYKQLKSFLNHPAIEIKDPHYRLLKCV